MTTTTQTMASRTRDFLAKAGLVKVNDRLMTKAEAAALAEQAKASPTVASNAPAPAARFSKADLDAATAKARATERGKVATVFASVASRGRERMAADLIAGHPDLSAAKICERLATMPTDAEGERLKAKATEQRAANVWDRALSRLGK